jgi:hypothetical protein
MARGEVSGRKPSNTATQLSPPYEAVGPPAAAYTIAQFCLAHGISQAMYFKEKAAGRGPIEMKIGTRRLISFESAAAWRRQREIATENA